MNGYDVIVVGGSLAGATAATLYARAGLSVALVERHASPTAYKRLCTHFLQPSATPAIERLGLAPAIEAAGGVRNALDVWSPYGWLRAPTGPAPYGYSIRREVLDPLVRATATREPGVTSWAGFAMRDLCRARGAVTGVVVQDRRGDARTLDARLVVGADGRHSAVAALAGVPTVRGRNRRALWFAHYRDLPREAVGRMWFHGDDVCYAYPNDDGVTVIAAAVPADAAEPERALRRAFARLPGGPHLADGRRVSPLLGLRDAVNLRRPAASHGVALVGDAAMASDPIWAVGCGWAFQSAEWLVDATAPALCAGRGLRTALGRYRRRHRRELLLHHLLIAAFSRGPGLRPHERLLLAAASDDDVVAARLQAFGERMAPAQRLLTPALFMRALRVVARRRRVGALSRVSAP